MKRFLAAMVVVGGLMMASSAAHAQSILHNDDEHKHLELEVHALLPYYYGFGIGGGVRVNIPFGMFGFLERGFVHSINDSFGLSVGADAYLGFYYAGTTYLGVPIHIDAQYNLFLTEKFSVFAEVGFVAQFNIWLCGNCINSGLFYPWFDVAVGGRYHFGANATWPALIARVGSSGLTVGISF